MFSLNLIIYFFKLASFTVKIFKKIESRTLNHGNIDFLTFQF